jgi:hypothetical protein
MMDIQIVNPIDYPRWDQSLLKVEGYSIFHSSFWAKVLSESYDYTPHYFTVFKNGEIESLIPMMGVDSILTGKRGVSLPFTDNCEPIVGKEADLPKILEYVKDFGESSGWKYVELRGGGAALPGIPVYQSYFCHNLDISREKQIIFSSFRKGTKSAANALHRDGIRLISSDSMDSVKEFCRLNSLTRKRHGLPPQPFAFFRSMHDHVISKGAGFISLAFYDEEVVAAAIFLCFGDKVIYKYAASDIRFQRLRANNLILWDAIEQCHDKGFKDLNFGRSEPENKGLRSFKAGWGTQESAISYYRYDLGKKVYITNPSGPSGLSTSLFSKMPIPLLKMLGSLLYRHVG